MACMTKLTWRQVAAWRVRRHHLERRAPAGRILEIASRLCGLHAQVLSCAELSAWARVEDLERGAMARALWKDRTLVKTWAMRGTLHLLPSKELSLWHAALKQNPRYLRPAAWKRNFGITLEELDRLTDIIGQALAHRVLTREELVKEVGRRSGSAAFAAKLALSSWGTVLKPAAFAGNLCFGPSVGPRVRFTRPDTWVAARAKRTDPAEALQSVTRRFLGAYGPATYHDLARWWGGGGVANAKKWIAALEKDAVPVDLEGSKAWMLAEDFRQARGLPALRCVRLLPGFDQYVVGASRHAERLLPAGLRPRVYRPQGWISPVLLVNGRMEGTWRHELRGSRVEVVVAPFGKAAFWVRRAAEEEAERLAAFFGGPLSLTWKK
jgi:winged helix DNA-binding protein